MASECHYVFVGNSAINNNGESVPPSRESYTWTDDMALRLIQYRIELKELFTRKKGSATIAYKKIATNLGIGAENYNTVKKKWENLVDKYRQEIKKIVASESEEFPILRSTWKFYDAMSEALGLEREKCRVKLSMMVNSNSTNTEGTNVIANTPETFNESSISNTEQTTIHTSNLLPSEPQISDPSHFDPSTEIKIETDEFEFDKIFVEEEENNESMINSVSIDNVLPKTEFSEFNHPTDNVVSNLNNMSSEMSLSAVNIPVTVTNNTRVLLPTHLRSILKPNITAAGASTSQAPSVTTGMVQSRPVRNLATTPAVSDAASSCSSDESMDAPSNKKSKNRKRAKKRKIQPDNDELLELIKKGDEELRNDFKQLIEIQRKTSEHIGALVNYIINKNK